MKILSNLILLIVFTGTCLAQSVEQAKVSVVKLGSKTFQLQVSGRLPEHWYSYATNDIGLGVEALQLKFANTEAVVSKPENELITTVLDPLFQEQKMTVFKTQFAFTQNITFKLTVPSSVRLILTGFMSDGKAFQSISDTLAVDFNNNLIAAHARIKLANVSLQKPLNSCSAPQETDHSILAIFFLGVAGGLLALLTPCVFPMIPLTVSWFASQSLKRSATIRNGMLYGIFIIVIYLLGSLPFHLVSGLKPEIFNWLSTNVWVNLAFFAVFVFFALSFFGLFEITVSGKLTNKADSKSDLGSIVGIFFMALTLALVSFSCTGPILGSLLVGSLSSSSGAWALTAGLGGFGLALALPFTLFALFPSWMRALPKSGGWLGVFKKSLAFIELALALKFLSNADLVAHWGVLPREVFLAVWLVIALLLAAYLLRIFGKEVNLNARKKISYGRTIFGGLTLLFAIYLGFGLFKKSNLELLSGFPPPASYSLFKSPDDHGLKPNVINDYQAALKLSKQTGKPLMLDFTGWACVNCRKMVENVWIQPEVAEYIKSNYILVSLYVDDRKELRLDQQFMYGKKEIKTIGDLYSTMESVNFQQVTQPLYVLLSPEEKLLNTPVGYTPDVEKYLEWLKCGINEQ